MTLTIIDQFGRSETNGWGTSDGGAAWTLTLPSGNNAANAAQFSVTGGEGILDSSSAPDGDPFIGFDLTALDPLTGPQTFTFDWTFENYVGSNWEPQFILVSGGDFYLAALYYDDGAGTVSAETSQPDGGSFDLISLDLTQVIHCKVAIEGTKVSAKFWNGSSEPGSYSTVSSGGNTGDTFPTFTDMYFYNYAGAPGSMKLHVDNLSNIVAVEGGGTTETKIGYITVQAPAILPYFRNNILLSIRASFNDENLFNHAIVIATGNKAQIYYGEASDTDPDSPTRIDAIGDRVFKLETDLITTQETANKAALKAFLDNCLVSEDIELDAICNPALEGNDVIGVQELTFSKLENNFRIQSFNIPLSSSRQSLKLARIINLQTQTVSVNDDVVLVGYEQVIKTTAATSATVNVPAGTTNGDLLLMWIALDASTNVATPTVAGFSPISGSNKWKYRVAASEGATKTVTWSGARRGIVTLLTYRNVDQSNPIAGLAQLHSTGKTPTIPGLTLASAEYHLVAGIQSDGVTSYTWPAGWTEQTSADTGGSGSAHLAISIADKPRIGANPPSFKITASDNLGETAYQIALRKDIS